MAKDASAIYFECLSASPAAALFDNPQAIQQGTTVRAKHFRKELI